MYYAIRKGVQTGVFESWDVCKSYIHGFRGAEFKKFKTKQEALHYLTNEPNDNLANETNEGIYVYCDGSCIHNGQSRRKPVLVFILAKTTFVMSLNRSKDVQIM